MSQLRVAFVAQRALARDGWGRYTVELVRSVMQEGITPVLVTQEPGVEPDLAGVEHHAVLPPIFDGRFSTVRSLRGRLRLAPILSGCDLVHNLVEPYLPLVASSCRPALPLVQTAHGTWAVRPFEGRLSRLLFRPSLACVSLLVCQSRYTRDRMAAVTALPRHLVLPAGVRAEAFDVDPPALRDGPPPGATLCLVVGATKPRKGIAVALDALAQAAAANDTLRLAIVGPAPTGSSPYERQVLARLEQLQMGDRVRWLGRVDAPTLLAWYHRADLFLFPAVNDGSTFEGLGLVCLEAAACGTPVIASAGCGAEDAVIDDVTGVLVPQGDPSALALAIERLAGDAAVRQRMGRAALAFARHLSWERLARRLSAEYHGLVQAAGRAQGRWR